MVVVAGRRYIFPTTEETGWFKSYFCNWTYCVNHTHDCLHYHAFPVAIFLAQKDDSLNLNPACRALIGLIFISMKAYSFIDAKSVIRDWTHLKFHGFR